MRARAFWRTVTADHADLLDRFMALLHEQRIAFCLIDGQAVNAYVDPVVSLDLDVVVAADDLRRLERMLDQEPFVVERFAHSLNISAAGSDLRIQIQTDPRYAAFVDAARTKDVLGVRIPVASVGDVLQGKIWAASDATRRGSKGQKDLADIARLIEAFPELRARVPAALLDRLM